MKLKILGCSGGIGGNLRTTSMLLDQDILIDAGTGVCDLSLEELSRIDHVFLSHSHLDHILAVPFMLDSVSGLRKLPLTVYALPETLNALGDHVFNWKIWPDFRKIPSPEHPSVIFREISLGEKINLNGRQISVLPANHVVPAVAFLLDSGQASLAYSGDTTTQDEFWIKLSGVKNLKYLIIETAFPNMESALAKVSGHLCPDLLELELKKLTGRPKIFISHLKPGDAEKTMQEIRHVVRNFDVEMLMIGQIMEF